MDIAKVPTIVVTLSEDEAGRLYDQLCALEFDVGTPLYQLWQQLEDLTS